MVSSCEGPFSLFEIWHLDVSLMKTMMGGMYWLGLRMGVISRLIGLGDNGYHPGAWGHFMSDKDVWLQRVIFIV